MQEICQQIQNGVDYSLFFFQITPLLLPTVIKPDGIPIMAEGSSYEAPNRATQYQSSKRFDNLQADVNQVVDVMKDNLEKVLERDAKLSTLENRADALQTGASQFTTNARNLKRKYWWKNLKMWAILIIVVIVLIIIIVVAVTQSVKSNNSKSGGGGTATTRGP